MEADAEAMKVREHQQVQVQAPCRKRSRKASRSTTRRWSRPLGRRRSSTGDLSPEEVSACQTVRFREKLREQSLEGTNVEAGQALTEALDTIQEAQEQAHAGDQPGLDFLREDFLR